MRPFDWTVGAHRYRSRVAGGKRGSLASPLKEFGAEQQLKLARCVRLGLTVLKLQEFRVWDELRIERRSGDLMRTTRRMITLASHSPFRLPAHKGVS